MPYGFPPQPAYPNAIDSVTTLYLVYDTTEAALSASNDAWDEEIDIVPVGADEPEVWADNGYVTLSGELIYYDEVAKDDNGKVKTLRRCLRSLAGEPPRHNAAGTVARGFVVAEHHNQLVDALVATEKFIGYNFDPDTATLDWRIRNLQSTQPIFDDFDCPNVDFAFVVESSDPVQGTVVKYSVNITGDFNSFRLNFGDGNFTTSTAPGTHQYAANATIDPVITVEANRCTLVQSPITRDEDQGIDTPVADVQVPVPIPLCPPLGDIFVEAPTLPPPDLLIPPVIIPGIDPGIFPSIPLISIGSIFISVPNTISLVGVSIPAAISVVAPVISVPDISVIVPSFSDINVNIDPIEVDVNIDPIDITVNPIDVNVTVDVNPIVIEVDPIDVNLNINANIPNIQIDVPSIPPIQLSPPPDGIPLTGPVGGIPLQPPAAIPIEVTVTCQCSCCGSTPSTMAMNMGDLGMAIGETAPWLGPRMAQAPATAGARGYQEPMEINYEFEGFPSTLTLVAPDLPALEVRHDIPRQIEVVTPPEGLRAELFYEGPPIPVAIDIRPLIDDLREVLEVATPKSVRLDASEVADGIQLIAPAEFPALEVEVKGMPSELRVVGFPDMIPIVYDGPSEIIMKVDENAKVPLVFEGPAIPVDVTVHVDYVKQLTDDVKKTGQCFMLVPCPG